jgi:NADPH-dependent curcumin reductase CurA
MNLPDTQTAVALARRPNGNPIKEDFAVVERLVCEPAEGEVLIRNQYFPIDAGFRKWMNEGSGDEYLPEMPLGEPVASLILGEVVVTKNTDFPLGSLVMGRLTWQQYCIAGADDFITLLPNDLPRPINEYLGILGGTGMTAYFGVTDICKPKEGEVALVSAAAGAVGTVAGQLLKQAGAYVIGISGSKEKCYRLESEYGFDATINYREVPSLEQAIRNAAADGVDIYFDNVGADTLNTVLKQLSVNARVALCGSIAAYGFSESPPGPDNMFELVTKRALLQGFMYTDQMGRFPEAMTYLQTLLERGDLKNAEYELHGIENAGVAFCDMFSGRNFGKTIVRL